MDALNHTLHLFPAFHEWRSIAWPDLTWLEKVVRPLVVYLFLLVAFRFSGKRELGQATLFDFLIVLLISNVVQNAMIGEDHSIVGAFAGVATLLTLAWALNRTTLRSRKLQNLLEGGPTLLIFDGALLRDRMDKESVSESDIRRALREQGVATLQEVRYGILELDGKISVIRADAPVPIGAEDCVVEEIRRQVPGTAVG